MWILRMIVLIIGDFFSALFRRSKFDDEVEERMLKNIKDSDEYRNR